VKSLLKKMACGGLALAMLVSLAGCGSKKDAPKNGGGQKINIRIASSSPVVEFQGDRTTALGISTNYFIKEIEKRSNGRIKAKAYPNGQIASSTQEYIGGLQNGAFDIGILNCGSWADYTTAYAGLNIPYLYPSYEVAYAVLDSEIGKSWQAKAQADTKTIPLGFFDIGFRELTANVPVHSPDDLNGIKIRTMPDPIQMACWKVLGANVTPVSYSELYTALQQKMVDAQENPVSNIASSKVYELQKYLIITNHNFTVTIPAASPVFWNKLSDEDKKLIQTVMTEAQNKGREQTHKLEDGFIKTIGTKSEIIKLTTEELKKFQDKAKSMWPMIQKTMGDDSYNKLVNFVDNYKPKGK
jgi:TRAP-type transport system periplasmic protein